MVIKIILDRKNFTDDLIWTLPDETGLFIGQWHAWQMFDKQPLLLWLSQFGDSFHKFWSSINKVDKENKDTGHIKDTGIGMTQEGLMKTCKQSSSAALQSFWASFRTLHLLVRWVSGLIGQFWGSTWPSWSPTRLWWLPRTTMATTPSIIGSLTLSPSLLMRSPLRMTWWKRRWMLRRRRRKMMNEEGTVKEDNKEDRKMRRQPYTGSCPTLPN